MIQHIIFDCDGVLIDTEIVAAEVMSEWLRENQHNISTEEFIIRHTGKTFSGIIKELRQNCLLSPEADLAKGVSQIENRVKQKLRPVRGVHEALLEITLPKSVVSNSSESYVKEALDLFEISTHFDGRIFSSEKVELPKPSPKVYEWAISSLGIPREEILVIEDSRTGVQAAHQAGLRVLGFLGGSHTLNGHGERLLAAGATELVQNHTELSVWLKRFLLSV